MMNKGEAAAENAPHSARLFNTTHWSVIGRAKNDSITALNSLFLQYREPMIVHLLGKPNTNRHLAEEFVQGFCVHLIKKGFLVNVAQQKGKFRTFLLTALNNYIRDQIQHAGAAKRGRGNTLDSLDENDSEGIPLHSPASDRPTADLEYDKAWAQALLRHSFLRLEEESAATGHLALCQSLEPGLFSDQTSHTYAEIAKRLAVTEGAVKTAAHRLKQRLRGILREEILRTVDESQFNEELAYLISLFGK